MRTAIDDRLGSPVAAATTAGGGFTRAFASVVETATGERVFLKAAPLHDPNSDAYAREATITSALPIEVPAPRPRWTLVTEGYFVLCLDAIDGQVPALPWKPEDLHATLSAWHRSATALRNPPRDLRLAPLDHLVRTELSHWSEIFAGRAPLPPSPHWVPARLETLAALEQRLPDLVAGPGMLHGDLRIDNTLIDGTGRAWLCDWTWPATVNPGSTP